MVKLAQSNLGNEKQFNFQQMDAQSIKFPDNSLDMVIACHMLYHVPDLQLALTEISRVLRPHGILYATTIASDHLQSLTAFLESSSIHLIKHRGEFFNDFRMESGNNHLLRVFQDVTTDKYLNTVRITPKTEQILLKYIASMYPPSQYSEYLKKDQIIRQTLREYWKKHEVFPIVGKSGILIARKFQ
ncbi:MAG: class I SAM-dependent methyltransferase [Promethearchaeota archaeon]